MENTNITSTESLLADIDKAIDAIQVDYMEPEGKETLSKDIALWSDRNVKERIAQVRAEAYKYRETAKLWMVSVTSALSYGHEWWAVRENPQFWLTQGKGYFGGSVDFQQAMDAAQVTGQVYRAIQRLKDIFEDVERKYKASSADTAAQQPAQAGKPAQPTNHTDKVSERDKGQYSDYMMKVFKNDESVIRLFLQRIDGAKPIYIICELKALCELGRIRNGILDKYSFIRKAMHDELAANYNVGSLSNWNNAINRQHTKKIEAIKQLYISELKKGQS